MVLKLTAVPWVFCALVGFACSGQVQAQSESQAQEEDLEELDDLLEGDSQPSPESRPARKEERAEPHEREPAAEAAAEPAEPAEPGADAASPADAETAAPAAAAPASAETRAVPAPRHSRIEEIVVTAQRRAESLQDVPIAISAFTGDDLKALGMRDTRDLGNIVPGFTASDSGYNTPVYTLRGVGFNDASYTATPTVGVYVDEVNLPYPIMSKGAALDLERVEVVKGPQGILYGRNTTGGAINFIARKPTDELETGVDVTYGRFQTTSVEGFVSGPLSGSLKGRFAVKDERSQEGWQYSNTRPDDRLGKQDKQAFRGALDWAASEDLSLRFVGEGWFDRSEARAAQATAVAEQNPSDPAGVFLPPQARDYPTVPRQGADPQVADWVPVSERPFVEWRLDDHFLLGALRSDWNLSDTLQFTGIAARMQVISAGSSLPQSGFNFSNAEQTLIGRIDTTALELRLSGVLWDETTDWMVGVNVTEDRGNEYHIEYVDYQSALFPDPATGQSTLATRDFTRGEPTVKQLAGFTNISWALSETLRLITGARYTQQDQHFTACTGEDPASENTGPGLSATFEGLSAQQAAQYEAETGEPGDPDNDIQKGDCITLAENGSTKPAMLDLSETNLSYRVALDWKPVDDYLFYASAARGFKAGGFPVTSATRQSQYTPVVQEEVDAFEVGSKTLVLDGLLQASTAAYYYQYKNKQLLTRTLDDVFGPLPILRNAPKSRVIGVELELQYTPEIIDGLFLSATGAYTDTKVLEFVGLDNRGNPFDFAGRPFNFAPKVQYTLLANCARPVNDRMNWTLGADYYHSDETNSTLEGAPLFAHDSYGLIGARVGLAAADDRWTAMAFGHNLANAFSTVAIYNNGDAISRLAGMPRTYGLTLSYRW